jgi:hypothetical protein
MKCLQISISINNENNNYFLFVNLFGDTFTSNLWLKLLDYL